MALSLTVDAGADPETWVNRLWEPGLPGPEINLGVRTGKRSRLMVLEVAKGPGEAILDQYGPWRAECIAVLGAGRERHFYAWQPSPLFDSASLGGATEFRWYGEGQVILVPPSIETESLETWQWLCPPWETPPQYPGQPVADFLQQHLTREPQPRPEVSLSWQEVYCLVSPFEPLLQALAASYPSIAELLSGDSRCGGGGWPQGAGGAPVGALARPPGECPPVPGRLGLPAEIGGRGPSSAAPGDLPGKCPLGTVPG